MLFKAELRGCGDALETRDQAGCAVVAATTLMRDRPLALREAGQMDPRFAAFAQQRRGADSDEAGHTFQSEVGHRFRFEAGRGSDLMSAT